MARIRSPNYPAIGLSQAVEHTKVLYQKQFTHPAAKEAVAKNLGYGGLNGASLSVISALKKYGLITGEDKELVITPDGQAIALDPVDSEERKEAIRRAALSPVLFAELAQKYGTDPKKLPGDEVIRSFLGRKGFTPDATAGVIRAFRETIDFLTEEGNNALSADKPSQNQIFKVKVGDYVQWESGGILQFVEPRRVNKLADNGNFVFVDGSATGIPINEVTIVQPSSASDQVPPTITPTMQQDVLSLKEGRFILQYPATISAESFEDFETWIQLQLRKIKRSVSQ